MYEKKDNVVDNVVDVNPAGFFLKTQEEAVHLKGSALLDNAP